MKFETAVNNFEILLCKMHKKNVKSISDSGKVYLILCFEKIESSRGCGKAPTSHFRSSHISLSLSLSFFSADGNTIYTRNIRAKDTRRSHSAKIQDTNSA